MSGIVSQREGIQSTFFSTLPFSALSHPFPSVQEWIISPCSVLVKRECLVLMSWAPD